jgi:iduronate 2-sulfatase
MHRSRLGITCSLILLAAAAAAAAPAQTPNDATARPNVLFIAVDDLRPELGCYGDPVIKSPNIDRLAAEGLAFTRAYCQLAACNASRASLLTGLRPDTLQVWDLYTRFRDHSPDVITLPQHFKQHGYHTVGVGKIYHNTIPDPASWSEPKLHIEGYPFDPDAVYRLPENIALQQEKKQALIREGKQKRYIDRLGEWYLKTSSTECADVPDDAYFDGAQTTLALATLKRLKQQNKPFFFAVGYYRPHLPFNAPKKYWDLYDRAAIPPARNPFLPKDAPVMAINNLRELRSYTDLKTVPYPHDGPLTEAQARLLKHGYLASVSYVDAQIGRLLDQLQALDLAHNTIVVLWGDHGWKLGEHRSWCKMTNHEVDTRVPLIISAPGTASGGKTTGRLVEFVDIYPTLCELAGLPIPETLEGTSAVPLFAKPDRPWKQAAFSQFLREGVWCMPGSKEHMGYSIRTERYRYSAWHEWPSRKFVARELYDRDKDPQENVNVAKDPAYAEVVKEMAARLKAGWRAARPK